MNKDKLSEYEYLWDKRNGWGLSQHTYSEISINVIFSNNIPNMKEIFDIRKLSKEFREISIVKIKSKIGNNGKAFIGKFGSIEANRIINRAKELNLTLGVIEECIITYLPVNKESKNALIIEDDELANNITKRMLDEGIPIIEFIESD
jgi:hypothetical protein